MPLDNFPLLSDLTKPTDLLDGWWKNASERLLTAGEGHATAQDQWIRRINLTVYDSDNGNGLDLSQLRITFSVKKTTNQSPNLFYARVYNLSPKTEQRVRQFHRVVLAAGYKRGRFGVIFDGTVVLYVRGKENTVDTYLDIFAGDGDQSLNNGTVILNFPAGTPPDKQITAGLNQNNIPIEKVDVGQGAQPTLRASAYIGPLTTFIRDRTNATQTDFFVDDGKALVIPRSGYRQGETVVLKPSTGLIGIPQITPQGIEIRCLLNPKLRLGGLVKLESTQRPDGTWDDPLSNVPFVPGSSEPAAIFAGTTFAPTGPTQTFGFAATSPTGTYKILLMEHTGDTRGNPWYSMLVCIAIGNDGQGITPNDALTRSVAPVTLGGQGNVAGTPPGG